MTNISITTSKTMGGFQLFCLYKKVEISLSLENQCFQVLLMSKFLGSLGEGGRNGGCENARGRFAAMLRP